MAGSPPEKIRNRKTRQVHEGWETDKEYHEDGGEAKGFHRKRNVITKMQQAKNITFNTTVCFFFRAQILPYRVISFVGHRNYTRHR